MIRNEPYRHEYLASIIFQMLPLDAVAAAPLIACAAVCVGGAAISQSTWDAFAGLGVPLVSQYGQTELGGMALLGSAAAPIGGMRPVPGVSFTLGSSDDAIGSGA